MIAKKLDVLKENNNIFQIEKESLYIKEYIEGYMIGHNGMLVTSNELHNQGQQNQIREALIKGYVEMSHINLAISMEYEQVEYEAQHTIERLVSGG